MHYIDRLGIRERPYIQTKIVIILWGIFYFLYPPPSIVQELGYTLVYISSFFSVFGCIAAIFGLLWSRSPILKRHHQGLIIEFSSLIVAICGPLAFFITVTYLTIHHRTAIGISFALLALSLCSSIFARILTVSQTLKDSV